MSWSEEWEKNRTNKVCDPFDHAENSTESCLRTLSF